MPESAKFSCKSCSTEIFFDVPDVESPLSFGEKIPCSNCGQVGCTYIPSPENEEEQTEYIEKCLKNYFDDKFTVQECLFLFSHLISLGIKDKFGNQIKQTAASLIDGRWIDEQGKILITEDEAEKMVEDSVQDGTIEYEEEINTFDEDTDDSQSLQTQQPIKADDFMKVSEGLISGVDPLKENREEPVEFKIRKRAFYLEVNQGLSSKEAMENAMTEFLKADGYSHDEVDAFQSLSTEEKFQFMKELGLHLIID